MEGMFPLCVSCKFQMKLEIPYFCLTEQHGLSQVIRTLQRWEEQLKTW